MYNKMEKKLKIWKNVREREHWCFFIRFGLEGDGNFFIAFTCSLIRALFYAKKGKQQACCSNMFAVKGE